MRTQTNKVRIVEQQISGTWLRISRGRCTKHKTAALALRAQKREDRKRAEAIDGAVASIVTWEPTTALGRAIANAIAGA